MRLSGTSRGAEIGAYGFAAACLLILQACALAPSTDGRGGDDAVAALAERLAGEYTNHAQVWAARQSGETAPAAYHATIVPLDSENPESRLLHFRLYREGHRTSPYREARFLLEPEAGDGILQRVERRFSDGWQPMSGCNIHWRRTLEGFEGQTRGEACRFRAPGSGEVVIRHRQWSAGDDGIVWRERRESGGNTERETIRFVPVNWYTGWAGVRVRGEDGRGTGQWQIERRLRVHDGGGERVLPAVDGQAHAIRLERLQWPNSGIRMLRLSVVEAESGQPVAYAWAPPGAAYIGIHLGWLQAGLEVAGTPGPREPAISPEASAQGAAESADAGERPPHRGPGAFPGRP